MFSQKSATGYSAALVGITEKIIDCPFDIVITVLCIVQECLCFGLLACFVEPLYDVLTTPFHRWFDPFLQSSTYWNRRRSSNLSESCQVDSIILGLHFFALFILYIRFCRVVFMLCLKLKIPITHVY